MVYKIPFLIILRKNDEIHGKGTCYYSNKHKYTGNFKKGTKNGRGKYIDEKGNIYDGE